MAMVLTLTMNPAVDVFTTTDRVVPVHKVRCDGVRRDPGGGGINVARVVRCLGGDCRALFVAGGPLGDLLRRMLDEENVGSEIVKIKEDTRESFTVHEEGSEQEYRFVFPGPELREQEWQACLDRLAKVEKVPELLVASGSLPPGCPDMFYAEVARMARSIGTRLALDTSGPALAAALEEGVYLVKPNLRELRELTGSSLETPSAWQAAAEQLVLQDRAEVVALTLGDQGAILATSEGTIRSPALPITIVSAVGAGDSFLGAMVWALGFGHKLPDAFRYGVAAGSAALLTPGTGLCRAADVERLVKTVRIDPAASCAAR